MKLLVIDTEQIVQSNLVDCCLPLALQTVFEQMPTDIDISLAEQTDECRIQKTLNQQLLLCANNEQLFHVQAHCANLMRQRIQLRQFQHRVYMNNVQLINQSFDDDSTCVVLVSKHWPALAKMLMPDSLIDLSFTPLICAGDGKNVQALLPRAIQTAQTYFQHQQFSQTQLLSSNQLMVKTAQLMGWHTQARTHSVEYSQRATALV